MKAQELAIINIVIQITSDGKQRQFPLPELSLATSVFGKIKKCTEDKDGQKVFIDGNPEFTSEENVFIKKLVEDYSWSVNDGETVALLLESIK